MCGSSSGTCFISDTYHNKRNKYYSWILLSVQLLFIQMPILVIPLVQDLLGQGVRYFIPVLVAVQLILIWTHCKMLCEEDRLDGKKYFERNYFNHSRSDIVCLQNPDAGSAGCHGGDEHMIGPDWYAVCRNGYCGRTS